MNWLRTAASGATPLLGSALVAVIFAPALPDVVVDAFGGGPVPNWLLRVAAIVVVLVVVVGTYYSRVLITRRRARHHGYQLADLEPRHTLVLPLGLRNNYQRSGNRTGRVPLACWLVDTIRPEVVIGVSNPSVSEAEVRRTRDELAADHVTFRCVRLTSAVDAGTAVAEADARIGDELDQPGVAGTTCYVDVTGGNVVLSIAMLQAAAGLGLDCVYVASDYDEQNNLIEGSQTGKSFDPRRFGNPPAPNPEPTPSAA